jgi:hypothetical protein
LDQELDDLTLLRADSEPKPFVSVLADGLEEGFVSHRWKYNRYLDGLPCVLAGSCAASKKL